MLSCKDASRLASQSQDRRLGLREKIGLRLHLWICDRCRIFFQQLRMIRHACQRIEESEEMHAHAAALSPDAKARILQELRSKQDDAH